MIRSRPPRFRVIASNLHRGGGVQVGASIVAELQALESESGYSFEFEVSREVANNLPLEARNNPAVEVVDRRPQSVNRWLTDLLSPRPDVCFVVFGPAWFPVRGRIKACGYADVTSLYEDPLGRKPSPRSRMRKRLSLLQLRRFDAVFVETEAIAARVVGHGMGRPTQDVIVVPNAASRPALEGTAAVDLPARGSGDAKRFLFTSAVYRHKNHEFLAPLGQALLEQGIVVEFVLTVDQESWDSLPSRVRAFAINLGPVAVSQLRHLHSLVDGAITPSLLEASSALPLEAIALGTPLFAADRDFNRTICGDAATYFDPLDPVVAAEQIATALRSPDTLEHRRMRGLEIYATLPTPAHRAHLVLKSLEGRAHAKGG